MHLSKTTGALVAAAALALPSAAFAQDEQPAPEKGKSTAPGQLCKGESKKRTLEGEAKSPFAACVVGVKRVERKAERTSDAKALKTAPGQLCKSFPKQKAEGDEKSPFAACVTGAAKAKKELRAEQRAARKAERDARKAERKAAKGQPSDDTTEETVEQA